MKRKSYFVLALFIVLFMSISPAVINAQKFSLVPVSSNNESMKDLQQQFQSLRFSQDYDQLFSQDQLQPSQQLQQNIPLVQPQFPLQPPEETLSEFEQYISETIDITEQQFEILQKYKIFFLQAIQPPPHGMIKVPVRIIKTPETKEEMEWQKNELIVNAGFLVGIEEEIATAFKILGIKSPLTVTTGIRQFGYDLFREPQSVNAPYINMNVPVGPGYVIGPGDEVRITAWGKFKGKWNAIADRDGNISLPKVGVIGISGLTFKELKDTLYKEFSKYYTGFEMNVSMGALRTIQVYVVGNALRPGAYTISSLSTLVNALFKAGGPGKSGTMRDIQLKRNGQTVEHFDMYDLLLKGNKSKDMRLMPEDVIFIPPVGHMAAIAGSVINPAIYELKGETSLSQLVEMSGGLSDIAFKGRVQITRIINKNRQTVFESSMDKIEDENIMLQSGDIVKVFQVIQDKKVVWLTGAVNKAGEYGFSKGLTIKDIITMAGGLKYYAYTKEAELTRIHISNEGPRTEKIIISLDEAMSEKPDSNIQLKENDYLFIRTIPKWKFYQIVFIDGEVNFPGAYIIEKGEKLSSLIARAGGYTDKAYIRGAVFTRERIKKLQQKQIDEMVERLERTILGSGAVETAAAISSEEAQIKKLELEQKRDFLDKMKLMKAHGRMVIVMDEPGKLKETPYDMELEDNDSLFIPTNPQSVQVLGSVYNQAALVYDKKKSVAGYIKLAGGYNEHADKKKTYILKVDGTAVNPRDASSGISWDSDSNRWEYGKNLEPGDTIVVPEKLERIAWMRHIKDITQILYQIATGVGVILVAY